LSQQRKEMLSAGKMLVESGSGSRVTIRREVVVVVACVSSPYFLPTPAPAGGCGSKCDRVICKLSLIFGHHHTVPRGSIVPEAWGNATRNTDFLLFSSCLLHAREASTSKIVLVSETWCSLMICKQLEFTFLSCCTIYNNP
jgi:hypothetical protein